MRYLTILILSISTFLLSEEYEFEPVPNKAEYFSGKFNSFVLMTYLGFVIIEVSFGIVPFVFLNFLIAALLITSLYSVIEYLIYPGRKVISQIFF